MNKPKETTKGLTVSQKQKIWEWNEIVKSGKSIQWSNLSSISHNKMVFLYSLSAVSQYS